MDRGPTSSDGQEIGSFARDAARRELVEELARVGAGDPSSLSEVYRRTSHKLFGICLRILHDQAEAEDVLQDVYVAVWRNAARFLDIDPFARIARSDATVGALRAKAAHVDISPIPGGGLKPVASGSVLSTADIYAMYQQGDARLGEPVGYLV